MRSIIRFAFILSILSLLSLKCTSSSSIDKLDVKNVLIITKNLDLLKNTPILDNNSSKYSQQFKNYVNYIKKQNDCNRIVVEFNDDTYANLNVCEGNI